MAKFTLLNATNKGETKNESENPQRNFNENELANICDVKYF